MVNFVDGRSIPIRKVVDERIDAPIWAYDEENEKFIVSRILSHHYNGEVKDGEFLTVTSLGVHTLNGIYSATVTHTHKFLTGDGWKTAGQLTTKDRLLTKYKSVISGQLSDFLAGALCGDSTVRITNNTHNSLIRFQDSNNPEYAAWKARLIDPYFGTHEYQTAAGRKIWFSKPSYELTEFNKGFECVRHPKGFFTRFSWLGFAIWMMDDACWSREPQVQDEKSNSDRWSPCAPRFARVSAG